MTVQQQNIPRMHPDFPVLDDMCNLAGTHIGHFHIIMPVHGKIGKAGMTPKRNLLAILHQAMAIDNEFFGKYRVKALVDLVFALQYFPFFIADFHELVQNILTHGKNHPQKVVICILSLFLGKCKPFRKFWPFFVKK